MDPETLEHWRAADALFDQWLDLPPDEREAWLAAQMLPAAVRQRLEQLLAAHRQPLASLEPGGGSLSGCRLGDWTLETELGRGGMAVVYRAWREQGMARQQAAIKILTLGALGATGRDRFRREAAILARLNHANITALVDSGVADDGTCWLAMPLVDGERIDRWCEAHSPDAHATVQMYLQVCDAVAYAHRNLVIHRDLKPSNVLVDHSGHVRLLDFGIGQFTGAEDERTQTLWRVLTPGYAAPEQIRGASPSTAIDVYGLGALLHRLLTGRTPQSATETSDTTRPSLLVRDADDAYHRHYVPLKNDLDRVLLKALAEEPEQRYATAEALADDLRRWLGGRPVLAQKPGLGYRLRKFAMRNKIGVAAGLLLTLSLAGGIGATLWQANEARRETENARVQAQRAVLVRDFLEQVFKSTEPASGDVPTALDLLDEGARRARSDILESDPLAAADILMLTGRARIGLSQYDAARADLEQARELFARLAPAARPERGSIEEALSHVKRNLGEVQPAQEHARAAVMIGERQLAETGDPALLLNAKVSLAMSLFASDPAASLALFEEVLEALPANDLQDTELHLSTIDGLTAALTAVHPDETGRLVQLAEEQIRLSRLLDGPDSGRYADTLADQVPTFSRAGNHARARELATEAASIADRVYQGPHVNRASVHCQLAAHLQLQGEYAEAVTHYAIANDISRELQRSDLHVQACFMYAGYVRAATGDYRGALSDLEHSWKILGDHDYRHSPTGLASCGSHASVQLRLGDLRGAADTLAGCPADPAAAPQLMHAQAFAELHFARGELDDAARLLAMLRASRPPEAGDRYWMRPWMLSLLLAHTRNDSTMRNDLLASLGDFAQRSPLKECLANPGKASCLVLP